MCRCAEAHARTQMTRLATSPKYPPPPERLFLLAVDWNTGATSWLLTQASRIRLVENPPGKVIRQGLYGRDPTENPKTVPSKL